ncbi:MAG: carbohydrate ABC transporter permease [Oscillospiraceae bacterium]
MKKFENKIRLSRSEKSLKITSVVFTILFTLLMLYPLLFTASNAAKDNIKIYDMPPTIFPDMPKSMRIVMDYSSFELTQDELLDTLQRDTVLTMFGTIYEYPRDSILELQFYGMKDGKTIFYSRAHQMELQLERDFGIYMGSVVKPKVLLHSDRYIRACNSIGYDFNINGLKKDIPNLAATNSEYMKTLTPTLTDKYKVQGAPIANIVKDKAVLLLESFKYYLDMPSVAYQNNEIVKNFGFGVFVLNSILVIGWAVLSQIILCSIVAFVVSRLMEKRVGNFVILFFLGAMMIPFASIMLPQLIMYKNLGFYNNYLALLVPFLCPFGFYVYLYKGFFDRIPSSYFEAGRLDGASNFYLYTRICMPLSKPIIFMIGLQTFISNWSDFFWAWMVTENQNLWTLNVALYNLSNNTNTKQNAIMGLSIITIIPVILLSLLFSKQLKQSIIASGVKG